MWFNKNARAARASLSEPYDVSLALERVGRAMANGAVIWNVQAEDMAESERSVPFIFTQNESAQLFRLMNDLLSARAVAEPKMRRRKQMQSKLVIEKHKARVAKTAPR